MPFTSWGSRVARKFAAKVLPFIATPVAIGAGITAGALTLFFHFADDIRGKENEGLWTFDHEGLELAHRLRTPARTSVLRFVSSLARPESMTWVASASLLGAILFPKYRPRGILMAVALSGGGLLIGSIKYRYARARPTLIEALAQEGTFSFPSGHSFIALILYGILASWAMRYWRRPWQRALIVGAAAKLIALVGASRVYLGVHYPSDVLAGYAAATPWLTACLIAYRQYERRAKASGLPLPIPEPDEEDEDNA